MDKIAAIFSCIFAVLVLSLVLVQVLSSVAYSPHINSLVAADARVIELNFNSLMESDTNTLSSTLSVLKEDAKIREIYLHQNRTELYDHVLPLFTHLKNEYGITHWYFISKDGKTFLRAHNKEIYGDEINRFTFLRARETGNISTGLELGKTAYALRAVSPYYDDNGTLIGYMELGEEIDHFIDILAQRTNSRFSLLADKEYIDKKDWESRRSTSGLRNNWNDLQSLLLLSPAEEDSTVMKCFNESNVYEAKKGKVVFSGFESDQKTFKCAGFQIVDAGERPSGVLLALIDVSQYIKFQDNSSFAAFVFSALCLTLALGAGYLFAHLEKGKKRK